MKKSQVLISLFAGKQWNGPGFLLLITGSGRQ